MTEHSSGDGWAITHDGQRRWGIDGAAGLLLLTPDRHVLMQLRAMWTNKGGTWALPGGARNVEESAASAALRETEEETGVHPADVTVLGEVVTSDTPISHVLRRIPRAEGEAPPSPEHVARESFGVVPVWEFPDHSVTRWSYTVVIGLTTHHLELHPTAESTDLRWQPLDRLEELNLMPEFARSLPTLRTTIDSLLPG